MKKFLAILMAISMVIVLFTSCVATKVDSGNGIEAEINTDVPKMPEKVKVQSFDELLKKRTEAGKNIENLSADVKCAIDLEMMGEVERVDMDMQIEADTTNTLTHMLITTTPQSTGETTTSEVYSDTKYTYTKDVTDEWFKHENDIEDNLELKALIEELKNKEIDYSKYVSDGVYSEETYDGKECFKLCYNMNLKLFDMISEFGIGNDEIEDFRESLAEEVGPEMAGVLFDMFSDLGTIPVTEYIDAYTLYPVRMSMDMTQALESIIDKIIDFSIASYGEGLTREDLGLEFAINELSFDMAIDSVNTTEITIPEEVLSAPEFTEDYIDEYYDFDDDYDDYDDYDDDYDDYYDFD